MDQNRALGWLQLVLVVAFLLSAIIFSKILQATRDEVGDKPVEKRKLFAELKNVSLSEYQVELITSGALEPRNYVNIVPQVSGQVVSVNPQFYQGGQFNEGELLFQIDPRDYEVALKRSRAELAQAQSQFEVEQARATTALADWKKNNPAKTAPDLVLRKPQLAAAAVQLKAAEAQYENAQINLERTRFTLPFSGRVTESNISVGQFVGAGQGYGRVFNHRELEVQSDIKKEELQWLLKSPQVDVELRIDGVEGRFFAEGELPRAVSEIKSATRFASVQFSIKEPEKFASQLMPGLFVEVHIAGPRFESVAVLPSTALQKDASLWIVDGDRRLRRADAERVYQNDSTLVVRGVANNTQWVVSRLSGALEGAQIQNSSVNSNNE